MNSCENCPVRKECHYPFKPTECVHQRKFWSEEARNEYETRKISKPTSTTA